MSDSDIRAIEDVDVSLLGGDGEYDITTVVLDAEKRGVSTRVVIDDQHGNRIEDRSSDASGSDVFHISVDEPHRVVRVFVGSFVSKKNPWTFDLYEKRPGEPAIRIDPKKVPQGPFSAFLYGLLDPKPQGQGQISSNRRRVRIRKKNGRLKKSLGRLYKTLVLALNHAAGFMTILFRWLGKCGRYTTTLVKRVLKNRRREE